MAQQASLESQSKAKALALLSQLNHVSQRHPLQLFRRRLKHAVRAPLADALQLLPQPLNVNRTLPSVLLHMDMLVQVAIVNQPVELRSGLMSEASCSLANRH